MVLTFSKRAFFGWLIAMACSAQVMPGIAAPKSPEFDLKTSLEYVRRLKAQPARKKTGLKDKTSTIPYKILHVIEKGSQIADYVLRPEQLAQGFGPIIPLAMLFASSLLAPKLASLAPGGPRAKQFLKTHGPTFCQNVSASIMGANPYRGTVAGSLLAGFCPKDSIIPKIYELAVRTNSVIGSTATLAKTVYAPNRLAKNVDKLAAGMNCAQTVYSAVLQKYPERFAWPKQLVAKPLITTALAGLLAAVFEVKPRRAIPFCVNTCSQQLAAGSGAAISRLIHDNSSSRPGFGTYFLQQMVLSAVPALIQVVPNTVTELVLAKLKSLKPAKKQSQRHSKARARVIKPPAATAPITAA